MVALTLVTAPAAEPISIDEAKAHARIDVDVDDQLVEALITTARRTAEALRNEALITQTWKLVLDAFPQGDTLRIPKPPLQSITHIKYTDEDDNVSTYASGSYIVDTDSAPGRVVLRDGESWPGTTLIAANGVEVQFVCGYGDAGGDVPREVRQAMLLLIGHWYENREEVTIGEVARIIPMGVEALLWFDRKVPGYSGL